MDTYRFGRKLKLPATSAIKHQVRKLMCDDLVKEANALATAELVSRGFMSNLDPMSRARPPSGHGKEGVVIE